MKKLFNKMPYLKFVVILAVYILFTGQTSTNNCQDFMGIGPKSFPFDPNSVAVPKVTLSSSSFTTGNRFIVSQTFPLPISNDHSSCNAGDYSYYSPSSVYLLIKNGSTILDSLKMSLTGSTYTPIAAIYSSFTINLPGTYSYQVVVNIQGYRLLGAENSSTITGSIISPGKYKLVGFSYTSNIGDTTYNYSGIIDSNKNYLNYKSAFRMESYLKLPFTAAEKSQYKWLTLDTLKIEYINGLYEIAKTNTIGNYDHSITYQGNKATFNGELSADSLVLRWKYGGNPNAPTFKLRYKKQ